MTTEKKLSFGIKTAQSRTTYEDMLRVWQAGVEEVRELLESGWE